MFEIQKMIRKQFQKKQPGIHKRTKPLIPPRIVSGQSPVNLNKEVKTDVTSISYVCKTKFVNNRVIKRQVLKPYAKPEITPRPKEKELNNHSRYGLTDKLKNAIRQGTKIPIYCVNKLHRKSKVGLLMKNNSEEPNKYPQTDKNSISNQIIEDSGERSVEKDPLPNELHNFNEDSDPDNQQNSVGKICLNESNKQMNDIDTDSSEFHRETIECENDKLEHSWSSDVENIDKENKPPSYEDTKASDFQPNERKYLYQKELVHVTKLPTEKKYPLELHSKKPDCEKEKDKTIAVLSELDPANIQNIGPFKNKSVSDKCDSKLILKPEKSSGCSQREQNDFITDQGNDQQDLSKEPDLTYECSKFEHTEATGNKTTTENKTISDKKDTIKLENNLEESPVLRLMKMLKTFSLSSIDSNLHSRNNEKGPLNPDLRRMASQDPLLGSSISKDIPQNKNMPENPSVDPNFLPCDSAHESERLTARECLKHPWLAKHRKASSTISSSKIHSPCKVECQEPRRASCVSCPEPRRAGCASCPPSSQSLRKYLSKSREALFERVLVQQRQLERQAPRDSLRRTTLLHQVNKTRRLCESQMSLVSKSRQKMIAEQRALLTRSREKLYGIKSLSKSHEVLNLYKSLVNLHDEVLPDILKNLGDKAPSDASPISSPSTVEYKPKIIDNKSNGHKTHEENKENVNNGNADKRKNGPTVKVGGKVAASGPQSPTASSETMESLESTSTTDSDVSEEDTCSTGRTTCSEEDEPRYTVKQLISAYNKHQEVVTKTSLEVTMSSDTQDKKVAEEESLKFPTGPNALRLFIPDIKITSRKKRMPRKKTGIRPPPNFDFRDDDATDESTSGSKMDLSAINARLNEIASLPDPPSRATTESLASTSPSSSRARTPTPTASPRPGLVSQTVQIFQENSRPDRKSFSSTRPRPTDSDKSRRKSSPPTMKPF